MQEGDINLNWKLGVEIELISPPGVSRYDLASAIAREYNGEVHRYFHPQVEPSKVPGTPIFNNLTLAYEVKNNNGEIIAKCVDDLTLQDDCNKSNPPKAGWYRIVSDESRLIQLLLNQCNPNDSVIDVLKPIAKLFGTELEINNGNMVRVADSTGAAIAIAAPLPGERERPCELIFPPINENHFERIESLLKIARSLGYKIPKEGATHIHFDAKPLESPKTISNLMRILWKFEDDLSKLVKTNQNCRRLGKWSLYLYNWTQDKKFQNMSWENAKQSLQNYEITKYCNFNIKNFIHTNLDKYTFEVRILPVSLKTEDVIEAAGLFEGILNFAISFPTNSELPTTLNDLIENIPLSNKLKQIWKDNLIESNL
ncbi:MAG: amidoligase family protein [Leptospiraceae bacterium]|nr:amidoligase family protein [Leptospiraceae bacterium]